MSEPELTGEGARQPPMTAGDCDRTTPLPATEPAGAAAGEPPGAIPGYEILHELGRGAMGVVYKARERDLDRLVAVKMVLAGSHAGPEQLERFRNEARAIAQLRHPNVVQVYHVGEHGGTPFFVLELVEGGSLAQALRDGPWEPRRAAALVEKLARATHAVHGKGIVHRDLKPGNVLLDPHGEPKIADFGLAKRLEEGGAGRTASNAALGTPSYMAPEQTGGRKRDVGPRTDVYALGAILYELLTGRPPFQADTPLDTLLQVVSEEPVPPRRLAPGVPPDLETICLKCLAKKVEDRYPDAAALAEDLRRFGEGEPVAARPPGVWRRFARWREKHPGTTVALILAAAFWLVGLGLTLLLRDFDTMPVFAAVLIAFVRPTRRTLAVCAATVLLLYLLPFLVFRPDPILFGVSRLVALLPALVIGTVGRVVAWAMRRDVVATTLGAFFGFLVAMPLTCCGSVIALGVSLGRDNMQKIQEFNQRTMQQGGAKNEEEVLEFYRQFDWTWPMVAGGTTALVCLLVPPVLGAVIGGAAAGRAPARGAPPGAG
jgi:predicted Ser/Thr protein kinase